MPCRKDQRVAVDVAQRATGAPVVGSRRDPAVAEVAHQRSLLNLPKLLEANANPRENSENHATRARWSKFPSVSKTSDESVARARHVVVLVGILFRVSHVQFAADIVDPNGA